MRLRAPSHELQLVADTGTVVRPHEWENCYLIRLDRPAMYRPVPGQVEELAEVVEDLDNLDVLSAPGLPVGGHEGLWRPLQ